MYTYTHDLILNTCLIFLFLRMLIFSAYDILLLYILFSKNTSYFFCLEMQRLTPFNCRKTEFLPGCLSGFNGECKQSDPEGSQRIKPALFSPEYILLSKFCRVGKNQSDRRQVILNVSNAQLLEKRKRFPRQDFILGGALTPV